MSPLLLTASADVWRPLGRSITAGPWAGALNNVNFEGNVIFIIDGVANMR